MKNKYLFAVRPGQNVCKKRDYHIMTLDGKCLYTDGTRDGYEAQGFEILNESQFTDLYIRCEAAYEAEICGQWQEITEEDYNEMLNVLPPLKWTNGGFFMSEFYTGPITAFYQKLDGRYYTSLQNVRRPRKDIMEDLRGAIAKGQITKIGRL